MQWTLIWVANFANDKLTLAGFADLWSENKNQVDAGSEKKNIFLAEPQIWYNATNNFSLGSEVKISSNFGGKNSILVCPTVAMKWNF